MKKKSAEDIKNVKWPSMQRANSDLYKALTPYTLKIRTSFSGVMYCPVSHRDVFVYKNN